MQDMEHVIRERAYHLWIEGGRPDGQADNYWLAAQREVLSASLGEIGRVMSGDGKKIEKSKKAKAPRKKRAA